MNDKNQKSSRKDLQLRIQGRNHETGGAELQYSQDTYPWAGDAQMGG